MHDQWINELVDHAHARVEGGRRILKDHGNHATDGHAFFGGAVGHVLTFEEDLARRNLLQSAHDVSGGGFTAAGLADNADGLTGHELQVHLIDRGDSVLVEQSRTGSRCENHLRILKLDDRSAGIGLRVI